MKDKVLGQIKSSFQTFTGNKKALINIMLVIVILLAALILRLHESSDSEMNIQSANHESNTEYIYIDIGGAVLSPGVYQVGMETRLYQVIEMAGGLTSNADTDSINQAAYVEDGEKIIIPTKNVSETLTENTEEYVSPYSSTAPTSNSNSGLVNINYASKEELKTLDGIGDTIAGRIIEYRETSRFDKIEDIKAVKGIGDAIFEKIKDNICV